MPWSIPFPRQMLLALADAVAVRKAAAQGVELIELQVPIKGLPAELEGFSLVQISDLHVGEGMWHPSYVREAADDARAAAPDVLVNTGDYFQWEPPMDKVAAITRDFLLDPRGGATPRNLSILGNHDYYAGTQMVEDLKRCLASLDVCLLVNDAVCVRRGGCGVTFVGFSEEEPGFDRAVELLLTADRPRIALVHKPELAERLPFAAADLVLAGHTHGGQMTVPGLEPFIVKRFCGSRYVHGMYGLNGTLLYINRGLGTTGLPFRIRARPEVTIIYLVR